MSTREQIIARHPIVDYLRAQGHTVKQAGVNFVTNACPLGDHKQGHCPVTIYTATQSWNCHDHEIGGSVIDWVIHKQGVKAAEAMQILGSDRNDEVIKTYTYADENGKPLFVIDRLQPKDFRARKPNATKYGIKGVRRVLYNLPAVIKSKQVVIAEGEKNCDDLIALGFVATTNPFGAGKWRDEFGEVLRGKDLVVFGDIGDPDKKGEEHTQHVLQSLNGKINSLKHAIQPDGFHDVSDWIASLSHGERKQAITKLIDETQLWKRNANTEAESEKKPSADQQLTAPVSLDDFYAYMPMHVYIFVPARDSWPAASVNARIPPVPLMRNGKPVLDEDGKQKSISASAWLDQNRPVEQMTWAPGKPMLIEDRLISEGGWIERRGCRTFNLYRPPNIKLGDAKKAGMWFKHVIALYPNDVGHIIRWLAHRVQKPHEKINHALFLGGGQGIR